MSRLGPGGAGKDGHHPAQDEVFFEGDLLGRPAPGALGGMPAAWETP